MIVCFPFVSQGYTIPLDKRLAADGRGLQQVHINENFAKLAEALYIADRKVIFVTVFEHYHACLTSQDICSCTQASPSLSRFFLSLGPRSCRNSRATREEIGPERKREERRTSSAVGPKGSRGARRDSNAGRSW